MMRRQRGFALIIVLWGVVALALGAAILTATGRRSLAEAEAAGRTAQAAAAIDSAVQQSIFHLLADGQPHWVPGSTHAIPIGNLVVDVAIVDQAGTINPNTASAPLLAALLVVLGRSTADADALANAIVEWRTEARLVNERTSATTRYRAAGLAYAPPAAPFQSIGELGLVLGMTPDLLARLRPGLSLWWDGDPDPVLAIPPVRAALRTLAPNAGLLGSTGSGITVVALICRIDRGNARAARRVVVQLLPTAPRPFHIVENTPILDTASAENQRAGP